MASNSTRFAQRVHFAAAAAIAFLLVAGAPAIAPTAAHADGPTTFSNTTAISVPAPGAANQIGPATPYPSTVSVSGMAGLTTDVQVTLHGVTHGILNDIDALLVSPSGENLIFLSDASDFDIFTYANNANLTFDDTGSEMPMRLEVPSGTYEPTNINHGGELDTFAGPAPQPSSANSFATAFSGIDPNGTWELYIVDDGTGDVGTIAGGWSISITTEAAAVATTTVVTSSDSTSFTTDPVTFTASVAAGGEPVTVGSVQFRDGSTNLGAPVALSEGGTASLTTSSLGEGAHLIQAQYSGATGFLQSVGTTSQRVDNETLVSGTQFCNVGTITVPQSGIASPYGSNIFVSGLSGTITSVTASISGLSHTAPIDYDILLSGPTPAQNVILMSDTGGVNPVSDLDLTFDDAAAGAIGSSLASGTYRPSDVDPDEAIDVFQAPAPAVSSATALGTFDGSSPNGTWTLWVVDDASGDSGSISGGWCLNFTTEATTSTSLTMTPNPSTFGQSVTLSATVTSSGSPVTAGTVEFFDGTTSLGAPVTVDASGIATFSSRHSQSAHTPSPLSTQAQPDSARVLRTGSAWSSNGKNPRRRSRASRTHRASENR